MGLAQALSRRSLLRAASLLAAGGALPAAGRVRAARAAAVPAGPPPAASPVAAGGTVRLVAAMQNVGPGGYGGRVQAAVEAYLAEHFSAAHPGVTVQTVPGPSRDRTDLGYQVVVNASLGGQGPDVLCGSGYQFAAFADAGALAPLDAYVRETRLDTRRFAPAHLGALRRGPGPLLGLPAFDAPDVLLVNLSLLADLGLPAPAEDWTADEAARLWEAAAGMRRGRWLYGTTFDLEDWITQIDGGALMDATGTRCLLDAPAVLRAAHWVVPLLQRRIAYPEANPPVADLLVRQGRAASGMSSAANVGVAARDMAALGARWDWFPMPYFPLGRRLTYLSGGWYGMNARSSRPPALVWDLLVFLTTDPGLQRLLFALAYVPPSRVDLWGEWAATVRAAAPALAAKRLDRFAEAMAYAVPNRFFRYQPYVAYTLLEVYLGMVYGGELTPEVGLAEAARQVNLLEAAGPAGSGAAAAGQAQAAQGFGHVPAP
jgi:ABC-type glycerol-3-phosphate transport system substrate-binding protein